MSALESGSTSVPYQESTLDKHRKALIESDNRKFSWFHVKTILVGGIGFFADAYDFFIINLVVSILGFVYYSNKNNVVPPNVDMAVKVAAAIGTIFGQLIFGYLGDNFGRKKMYALSLAIIIVATIGTCFSVNSRHGEPVWISLIAWRLLLGFGIGGDYPLSATMTSEHASKMNRGSMLSAVISCQGLGILGASIVSLTVLSSFKAAIEADVMFLDYIWRICIGFGVFPALFSIYFRLTLPETPRYLMEQEQKAAKIAAGVVDEDDKATWRDFISHFSIWSNFKILLGTTVTWFAVDVAFFGINLNNSVILNAIGFAAKTKPYELLYKDATGNLVIALLGTVPGYWFTVFFVDTLGRKRIQIAGFGILTILFIVLGVAYHSILNKSVKLFIVIFTAANFFLNFGPNVTTFVIPGEVFPTKYRSTAHGISAASGKIGAIVSQVGFSQLKDVGGPNAFVDKLLIIFGAFMLLGLIFTFLIPESTGRSLEEINNEYTTVSIKTV